MKTGRRGEEEKRRRGDREYQRISIENRKSKIENIFIPLCSLCVSVSLWWIFSLQFCDAQDKPLSQTDAVMLAARQSPQARAAKAARDVAQAEADRNKPAARPTLNAIASGTAQGPRVTFPRPDYTPATVLPEGATRLDLVLEQTVYRAGIGAAKQRYAAQSALVTEDYRKTLSALAQMARKSYMDVLRAQSGVRTAQEGLDAALRYQQTVDAQIRAGVAKPVDATMVTAQVSEAQGGIGKAAGGLRLAQLAFNKALGRGLNTPVALEALGALPIVPDNPDAAIAIALQNRPELISLELNLQAARAGVSLARLQGQPVLNARGQFTEQTPTAFQHEHYYGATLELRWTLLDGGKIQQDTREAKSQVERLEALREDARQGIAIDVTQAWQNMVDAQAQIGWARARVIATQAFATVAEKAYEVGRGTVLEAQAAQREVRSARERELQATHDLYSAAIDFAHAQGTDVRELESIVGKR